MKINDRKSEKCRAARPGLGHLLGTLFRKWGGRPPSGSEVRPNAAAEESPKWRLNPLERIRDHLRHVGLGQQVRVRFETAGGDFILEDNDGLVHAKDYDEAVVVIERMWLYQP